jgi:hypothetical protein
MVRANNNKLQRYACNGTEKMQKTSRKLVLVARSEERAKKADSGGTTPTVPRMK